MREELSEAEFRLPIQLNAKIERKQGVLPDETCSHWCTLPAHL